MQRVISIILFCMLPCFAFADSLFSKGTDLSLNINQNGGVEPYVTFPFAWNKYFFSYLAVSAFNTNEIKPLYGFADSKMSSNFKEYTYTVAPIGFMYQLDNFDFQIKLNYEYKKGERNEFGYFQLPQTFGSGYAVADSEVKTDLHNIYVTLAASYTSKYFYLKVYGEVSPLYIVVLNQKTQVKPLVSNETDFSETTQGPFNFNVGLDLGVKLGRYIGISAGYKLNFIPYDYNLMALDYSSSNNNFFFSKTKINNEEMTHIIRVSVFSPLLSFGGLYPTIGYEVKMYSYNNKTASEKATLQENRFIVGMIYEF